jgi:hypothetical protein
LRALHRTSIGGSAEALLSPAACLPLECHRMVAGSHEARCAPVERQRRPLPRAGQEAISVVSMTIV